MKRLLALSFVFHLFLIAYSQPVKDNIFIGGQVAFYYNAETTGGDVSSASTHIILLPEIGYFAGNRNAIGTRLGLDLYGTVIPDVSTTAQRYLRLEIFHRYYLIAGVGGLYMESSFDSRFGKRVYEQGGNTTSDTDFSLGINETLGAYYFITPNISLEGQFTWLGFQYSKVGDEITKTAGLNLNPMGMSFGIIFVF